MGQILTLHLVNDLGSDSISGSQSDVPSLWPGTPVPYDFTTPPQALRPVWIGVSADGTTNQIYPIGTTVATIIGDGWVRVYQGTEIVGPSSDVHVFSEQYDQILRLLAACCATSVVTAVFALRQSNYSLDPEQGAPPCNAEAIFKWLVVRSAEETRMLTYSFIAHLTSANTLLTQDIAYAVDIPLTTTVQLVKSWSGDFAGLSAYALGTIGVDVTIKEAGTPILMELRTFRLPDICVEESASSSASISESGDSSVSASASNSGSPFSFIPEVDIAAFGDSITAGQNATAGNGYIQQFAAHYGVGLNQLAVSARGVWQMAKNAFQNPLPPDNYVVAMAGLNDYRRSGTNVKTDNKLVGCYKSLLVEQFLDVVTNSDAPDTVWSGDVPTHFSGLLLGARSQQLCNYIQNFGACEWGFSGTAIAVGIMGNSGVEAYGTVKVYVDAVLYATVDTAQLYDGISDGAYDNERGPYAIVIFGLAPGAHTVRFEGQGDGYCVLDYFATLKDPSLCKPVVLCEIPHLNATGYATVPDQANDTILDSGSGLIEGIVNEFIAAGFPVLYFPTNDFYNVGTGISGDNIHPSDTGHADIEVGLIDTVENA